MSETTKISPIFNDMLQEYYRENPLQFAMEKHKLQKRKYTGDPYWVHLVEVQGIAVSSYLSLNPVGYLIDTGMLKQISTIAMLHDVIEDKWATEEEIEELYGKEILKGVLWLTDRETGNRQERKKQAAERIGKAPGYIQLIKLADVMSNTASIALHDPKFAKTYLKEKEYLLECIHKSRRYTSGSLLRNSALFFTVEQQMQEAIHNLNQPKEN